MAYDKIVDSTQLNSDLTSVANAIRTKGGTSAALAFPSGFVSAIGDIPGGTEPEIKDVNFFDYDGTVIASYTAAEFSALEAFPANPSHDGLTAQGWNWSLAQAKAEVLARGACNIGQIYITSDGKTRIYCSIDSQILTINLGINPNGTVAVDWGDGSETDTITGTSLTTLKTVSHTYSAAGDYVIALSAVDGEFAIVGNSQGSNIVAADSSNKMRKRFLSAVRKIEIGSKASFGNDAFSYCAACETITIPNGITEIPNYAFTNTANLKAIVLPSGITSIGTNALQTIYSVRTVSFPPTIATYTPAQFSNYYNLKTLVYPAATADSANVYVRSCMNLRSVVFPSGITSIAGYAVESCYSIKSFTIPANVGRIEAGAFRYLYSIRELHFKPAIPPTAASNTSVGDLPTTCIIYVPAGHLSDYTSATNYPDPSIYTYVEE